MRGEVGGLNCQPPGLTQESAAYASELHTTCGAQSSNGKVICSEPVCLSLTTTKERPVTYRLPTDSNSAAISGALFGINQMADEGGYIEAEVRPVNNDTPGITDDLQDI